MWGTLLPILGSVLGGALAGRGSGMQANPAQLYAQLFQQQMGQLQQAMMPAMAGIANMAQNRGAALGQDLAGSMGAIGAMGSGAGRAAYSLGQTAGSQLRQDAESQMRQALVEMSRQNAMGLLAPQMQFVESQRSGGENFAAWLAQVMSGGQLNNVFGQMFNSSTKAAAQGTPIGGIGMSAANGLMPAQGNVPGFMPTNIFQRKPR